MTIRAPIYVSETDPATAAFSPVSNVQSSFSGEGPTDVDFRVKPDLMAPGENVISSVPGDCGAVGCWAVFKADVDGDSPPRRCRGRGPWRPSGLDRRAGPLGDRQHRSLGAVMTSLVEAPSSPT